MLAEIWRYPVKSCAGELIGEVDVQERGLSGDRAWAVVDSQTGLVASAKRPPMWAALLTVSGSLTGSRLTLHLGDGRTASSDEPGSLDELISSLVGRSVSVRPAQVIAGPMLERTDPDIDLLLENGDLELGAVATGPLGSASPDGTVFDFAPVHVISSATLEVLEASDATAGDPRRFRPNLVVDIDGPAFQENDWPGHQLRVGTEVVLDMVIQSPRCVVPSLPQADLPQSPSTLRAIARLNRVELEGHGVFPCVGAHAKVAHPGTITTGTSANLSP